MNSGHARGRQGEAIARTYLEEKGYNIEEANFRCPGGEIDIVARLDGLLVFVEVKTRVDPRHFDQALSPKQAIVLQRSALAYMAKRRVSDEQFRFLILFVTPPAYPGGSPRIDEVEDPF